LAHPIDFEVPKAFFDPRNSKQLVKKMKNSEKLKNPKGYEKLAKIQ